MMKTFTRHLPRAPLLRIDDRLIHGQVAFGWGQKLGLRRLILANDNAAEDASIREVYSSLIPPEIEGMVLSLKNTIEYVKRNPDCRKVMVVVESPADALYLVKGGMAVEKAVIGGLHHCEGRRQILPYVFLNQTLERELMELKETGVALVCQDLPTSGARRLTDKDLRLSPLPLKADYKSLKNGK